MDKTPFHNVPLEAFDHRTWLGMKATLGQHRDSLTRRMTTMLGHQDKPERKIKYQDKPERNNK